VKRLTGVERLAGARRLAGVLLLALLAVSAAARGEDWHGRGRASGRVLDAADRPLPDARVTLRAPDGSGPPPTTTDRRGRWAILGLAGGRYALAVEAVGHIAGEGWVDVADEGPGSPLTVVLRPLSEVTPGGAENPQAVYTWIGKGNSLLAQGKPAAARAEYAKALAEVPREQRPEILQAVARTWFLEGNVEQAVETVKEGLRLAPGHELLRQLLRTLLAELGREAEADPFLAGLTAAPASNAADAEAEEARRFELPPEIATAVAAPAEAPTPGRQGAYKVAFAERSPWGTRDEVLRRGGTPPAAIRQRADAAFRYDLAEESFQVVVPAGEAPPAGWGLLVWVSPGFFGGTVRPEMRELLAQHRLIWVGANQSGNDRVLWDRWALALDAVWNLRRLYAIDPERVYVAGFSGGGRVASALTMLYPDVFRAGLMVMGIDWYHDLPVPDQPGAHWPAPFEKPPRDLLRLARDRRFVVLTGEHDFNRAQSRVVHRELEREGFAAATYLEVPGMSHYDPVPGEWLARAFSVLDPTPSPATPGGAP
jgi:tetratricopeptide (TPR) repeat protein